MDIIHVDDFDESELIRKPYQEEATLAEQEWRKAS